MVVLPAPLGPSSPNTSPCSTVKLTPAQCLELAVALPEVANRERGQGSSSSSAMPATGKPGRGRACPSRSRSSRAGGRPWRSAPSCRRPPAASDSSPSHRERAPPRPAPRCRRCARSRHRSGARARTGSSARAAAAPAGRRAAGRAPAPGRALGSCQLAELVGLAGPRLGVPAEVDAHTGQDRCNKPFTLVSNEARRYSETFTGVVRRSRLMNDRTIGRAGFLGILGAGALGLFFAKDVGGVLDRLVPSSVSSLVPTVGWRIYTVGAMPNIDPAAYRLRVDGLVESPQTFTLADLKAMPRAEQISDFRCVTGWKVSERPLGRRAHQGRARGGREGERCRRDDVHLGGGPVQRLAHHPAGAAPGRDARLRDGRQAALARPRRPCAARDAADVRLQERQVGQSHRAQAGSQTSATGSRTATTRTRGSGGRTALASEPVRRACGASTGPSAPSTGRTPRPSSRCWRPG